MFNPSCEVSESKNQIPILASDCSERHFYELPEELIKATFSNFKRHELYPIRLVCRKFKEIIGNSYLTESEQQCTELKINYLFACDVYEKSKQFDRSIYKMGRFRFAFFTFDSRIVNVIKQLVIWLFPSLSQDVIEADQIKKKMLLFPKFFNKFGLDEVRSQKILADCQRLYNLSLIAVELERIKKMFNQPVDQVLAQI